MADRLMIDGSDALLADAGEAVSQAVRLGSFSVEDPKQGREFKKKPYMRLTPSTVVVVPPTGFLIDGT